MDWRRFFLAKGNPARETAGTFNPLNLIFPRVCERQMDGCMAHICTKERFGRIIGRTRQRVYDGGYGLVHPSLGLMSGYPMYRIQWDDGEVTEWFRDDFHRDEKTGILTRWY